MLSGFLFTANNFVINQTSLTVSDLLLVRTTIQVILFSILVTYRGESILPSTTTMRFYTVLQGKRFNISAKFLKDSRCLTLVIFFHTFIKCKIYNLASINVKLMTYKRFLLHS